MEVTERFSGRVENYAKYRPRYPEEVIPFLEKEIGLTSSSIIADIGSGTGISSEIFLKNGNHVYGVEPNKEMREAGERLLAHYKNFRSINGAAEVTTLPDSSIDFISAGQAFHWFDVEGSKKEFRRILKENKWVVLFWNERHLDATPFLRDFEKLLLDFGTDYPVISQYSMYHKIDQLFSDTGFTKKQFPNKQVLNYEGLKGRLLSDSYIPTSESPVFEAMLKELQKIFDRHQIDDTIEILYDTDIYYGKL